MATAFRIQDGSLSKTIDLPERKSMTGPMAMADTYGDSDLDLSIGGRTIPGESPRPASSTLFRNNDGSFATDREHETTLGELGLVSGAVSNDLGGDGDPDLVLAVEWDSLTFSFNR